MSDGAFHIGGYEHELDFEIPVSVQEVDESLAGWPYRKPNLLLFHSDEPSEAMRLIGREVCRETKRYDLREMRRAYNRRDDD